MVTGGAGFIGSALVRHLVGDLGVATLVVDKLTYAASLASLAEVADRPLYSFERADIIDRAKMRSLLDSFEPDIVMHLAAETSVDRSLDHPEKFVTSNVVGTFALIQEVLDYWRGLEAGRRESFRFHHVSTDEVFGALRSGEERFHETSRYKPTSPYAASKAAADHFVRAWRRSYGLPIVLSNCSNNYGPYQFPEKLIPLMVIKGLVGEKLPIFGAGENVRDWLHVEDHVRALWAIATRGTVGETYLVGADEERRNIDVVRLICRILDDVAPMMSGSHERLISFAPDRPGHDLRYAVDATRLRQELGWSPQINLEAGLRETVLWYRDRRDWWNSLIRPGQGEPLGQPG